MKRVTRIKFGTVALLVLLALLTLLVIRVKRKQVTAEEAAVAAAHPVVTLVDSVIRYKYAAVACGLLVALFAFVMWSVLLRNQGEIKAKPPDGESSASGATGFR